MQQRRIMAVGLAVAAIIVSGLLFYNSRSSILTGATIERGDGQIAYLRYSDQDIVHGDLYILDAVTGESTQLTRDYQVLWAEWSPDGEYLALSNKDLDLAILQTDTGQVRWVNDMGFSWRWSPDDTQIGIQTVEGLFGFDVRSDALTDLIDNPEDGISSFAWAPDGRQIAFWNDRDLFVMNADGSDLRAIADGQFGQGGHISWSPDGRQLAFDSFVGLDGRRWEIFLTDTDGSSRCCIAAEEGISMEPRWSPDGRFVAFQNTTGYTESSGQLVIADVESEELRVVGDYVRMVPFQDWQWSPDGQMLRYTDSATREICFYDLNSAEQTCITGQNAGWSPDGSQIVYQDDDFEQICIGALGEDAQCFAVDGYVAGWRPG